MHVLKDLEVSERYIVGRRGFSLWTILNPLCFLTHFESTIFFEGSGVLLESATEYYSPESVDACAIATGGLRALVRGLKVFLHPLQTPRFSHDFWTHFESIGVF